MAKGLIRHYIWLIDTIRSANGITYEEICRKWSDSPVNDDNKEMKKRAFFQHLNDIRYEFGVGIVCDRRDYKYYIEDDYSEYGSIRGALVDALVLNNAITEMPAMSNRILLSQRFSQENLGIITHAIQQNNVISFRHIYNDADGKNLIDDVLELEPYGVVYMTEWFVIGRVPVDSQIHIFDLKWMSELETLAKVYSIPEDFDLHYYCKSYSWVESFHQACKDKKFSPIVDDSSWFEASRAGERY